MQLRGLLVSVGCLKVELAVNLLAVAVIDDAPAELAKAHNTEADLCRLYNQPLSDVFQQLCLQSSLQVGVGSRATVTGSWSNLPC